MHRLASTATLTLVLGAGLAAARAEEPLGLGAAQRLLAGSRDPGARARGALRLSAAAGDAEQAYARPALAAALGDEAAPVRRLAAAGLARMPAPGLRPRLLAALERERDREVLPALLLAVGALADPSLTERVAAYGRDPAPAVRAAALSALGDLGGEPARRRLLAALVDPGGPDEAWSVRAAAVLALAHAGRRGDVGAVLAAMRTGGGWACWLARSALARAVPAIDPDPLPLLEHLMHDGDARVALTAAEAVARAGHPERLLELLRHPGESVRAAAAGAAAQAGLEQARPRLLAMARGDVSLTARWAAALALFRLDAPEGDELVLAGLASNEAAVWVEALAALESRTGAAHGRDVRAWREALARRRAR